MSGLVVSLVFNAALFIVLVLIASYDIRTSKIPDSFNAALLAIAFVGWILDPGLGLSNRFIASVIVSGLMLLTEIIRPESIGGGDIKMMVAAGLLLGIQNVLIAALIGICSAGLYAAGLLIVKKASMGEKFAYGPFLCLGVWAAHLFGAEIVSFLF